MSQDLMEVMQDVRDRVIRIETRIETLPTLQEKIDQHEKELIKAKVSVNMLRWLAGLFFVSIPASVYAMVRVFKG